MKRKRILWVGAAAFILIIAWFGSNLLLFMIDYRDEMISLENFRVSILSVETKANDTLIVRVNLENSYSRDILLRLLVFNVFEKENDTILVSGMIDYTVHGETLLLPGYSEHMEEFVGRTLGKIEHNTPLEVRVEVRVMIKTLYFGDSVKKAETDTVITFH